MSYTMKHNRRMYHEGLTKRKRELYSKRLLLKKLVKQMPVRSFPKNYLAYREYADKSGGAFSARWVEDQFQQQTWDEVPEQYIGELNG